MGKLVKAIFIGALVGLTGGLLLPVIGLASPFAGLFGLTGLAAAAVGGAITGGLALLLAPSVDLGDVRARLQISIDPNALGKWVFGETALATDIMFAATHGPGDKFISHIIAGAMTTITEYGDLYINDELVPLSGGAATGEWQGGVWIQRNLGTEVQTAFTDIDGDDDFSPDFWPTTADGLGIAHYRIRWAVGHNIIQNEGGIPSRVTQVAKGAPVYDPRLDSTRGGSGTHRADDQSTWEYNDGSTDIGANWALIVLFYLLGWRHNGQLVLGVGADPDDIDMAQAMAAANVCDALVDSIPRYHIGGLIAATQDHPSIIQQLESAINGKVARVGGRYYIWAPHDDLTPFSSIGDEDIVREVGVEFHPSGPIDKLYNTARGRYVEPSLPSLFQPIPYPEVVEAAAVTEDERTRSVDHDFALIQNVGRAERVARHIVRRSRFGASWRFAMGPKGLTFRPFTVTTLNIKETNYQDVTVRIVDMTISKGVVLVDCLEEDSSIYDTTAPLGTPITQNDPGDQFPSGPRLSDANIHNSRVNATVKAGIRTNESGQLEYGTPSGGWTSIGVPAGEWAGSLGPSVEYWVHTSVNSGTLSIGTEDTWESLTQSRFWEVEQASEGVAQANITTQISLDDSGGDIVARGDFDLKATYIVPVSYAFAGAGAFAVPDDGTVNAALDVPNREAGDLLLVFAGRHSGTPSTPDSARWELVAQSAASGARVRIWARIATNDADDNFDLTGTGGNPGGRQGAQMAVFSGNPFTPLASIETNITSLDKSTETTYTYPTVTLTGSNNTLALVLSCKELSPASAGAVVSAEAGLTIIGQATTIEGGASNILNLVWGFDFQASPSAIASGEWDLDTTAESGIVSGIGLRLKSADS